MMADASCSGGPDREAKILYEMGPHPNIVRFLGFSRIDNRSYLLLKHYPLGDLRAQILRYRQFKMRFDEQFVLKFVQQSCAALDFVHRSNIVYRDFKPSNVFINEVIYTDSSAAAMRYIDEAGIARTATISFVLADFGIAVQQENFIPPKPKVVQHDLMRQTLNENGEVVEFNYSNKNDPLAKMSPKRDPFSSQLLSPDAFRQRRAYDKEFLFDKDRMFRQKLEEKETFQTGFQVNSPAIRRALNSPKCLQIQQNNVALGYRGYRKNATLQNQNNEVIGTPGYMAPEYRQNKKLSWKVDMFGLGASVLEVCGYDLGNFRSSNFKQIYGDAIFDIVERLVGMDSGRPSAEYLQTEVTNILFSKFDVQQQPPTFSVEDVIQQRLAGYDSKFVSSTQMLATSVLDNPLFETQSESKVFSPNRIRPASGLGVSSAHNPVELSIPPQLEIEDEEVRRLRDKEPINIRAETQKLIQSNINPLYQDQKLETSCPQSETWVPAKKADFIDGFGLENQLLQIRRANDIFKQKQEREQRQRERAAQSQENFIPKQREFGDEREALERRKRLTNYDPASKGNQFQSSQQKQGFYDNMCKVPQFVRVFQ